MQWAQANVYIRVGKAGNWLQDGLNAPSKPNKSATSTEKVMPGTRPQYVGYATSGMLLPISRFLRLRHQRSKAELALVTRRNVDGTGTIDDSATIDPSSTAGLVTLQNHWLRWWYLLRDQDYQSPPRLSSQAWSTALGNGSAFSDQSDPHLLSKSNS